jgi:aspartate aminotransferase-like enzyme
MKNNILLTPGPTPVPEAVRQLMAEPMIHHRTPQYQRIFEEATKKLQKIYMTKNSVYTITGSGTSAMEAAIVNFHSVGDEILVIDGGKFGERFTELANAFGLKPTVLKVTWGEAVKPADVEEALRKNPNLKSVCCQLCETSTAVLYDIQALGKIVAKTNALLIVDAISGLGADRLETDAWGVDLVASGSQKALMLPPGLGFLSVSEKAKKRMASSDIKKYYLDLKLYEKGMKDWDTPWTPALTIVIGLNKALDMMEAEGGVEQVFKRSAELAKYTRDQLQALGLKIYSKAPSQALTAAYVPEGMNGEKLVKILRDEKGVTVAGGQGELKGKIIRIAHMGAITKQDLETGFAILKQTIQEMRQACSCSCSH